MFLVLQIPAFHVPGFKDSGFSCSWFYRFRLFMFLVLQIPAFHAPGFTDSGFSYSWFSRSSFLVPFPDSPFLVLQIVRTNQLQTNFLDLTLDLSNNTYKPYRKPNDTPLYINRLSNHPPSILKRIPSSIQQRINSLSHNQQAFDTAAPIYNDALKRSNFHAEINYEPSANTNSINKRRTRQRNTIWYNPPFSKNVTTNIARNFLLLLDKHFPPHHRLHSIFNRHTVRVSYSCSDNMESFLSKHNKYVLKKHNGKAKNTKTNIDTKTLH